MDKALRTVAVLSIVCLTASCGRPQSAATSVTAEPHRPWRDEIVYAVIVEKFFNGDKTNDVMLQRYGSERSRYEGGYWGGDLAGVIQKLDYLQSLGVTALLIYPVMANDAGRFGKFLATGYRPRDYYQVDENFGDLDTLKRLIAGAHQRKMRVLLDLPLGMPGSKHPYYRDPEKRDWFGKTTRYGIRQWNADNPQVARYLIDVSKFWKVQTGCDGFRLDSAQLHSEQFWRTYCTELKRGSEDFILLAELPLDPPHIDAFVQAAGFDSAYDFSVTVVQDVFGQGESVRRLSFNLGEGKRSYTAPDRLCAQIDMYDDPAFAAAAKEPVEPRMKLGLALLLTLNRVPLLYCGDEVGISFREVGELFTPSKQASPLLEYTRRLIALRKNQEALRHGDFLELFAADDLYAFARTAGDEQVVVILNNAGHSQRVRFPIGDRPWQDAALQDLLSQRPVKARGSDEQLEIERWGIRVLKVGK